MSAGNPAGMIAHCCREKDGGIAVIDIWESKEHFEAFIQGKVMPTEQSMGINSGGPQNLTMTEVLNADSFAYTGEVLSG